MTELTDDDIRSAAKQAFITVHNTPDSEINSDTWDFAFARAIIAAHEAQRQAGQEPVAHLAAIDEYGPRLEWLQHWVDVGVGAKLFAAPRSAHVNLRYIGGSFDSKTQEHISRYEYRNRAIGSAPMDWCLYTALAHGIGKEVQS